MAPSFLARHGHHSGTIVGILIIIIAIWLLHSTGIFMYVLFFGIICVLVALGIHFYKRRQMLREGGEYGELPSASSPLRQDSGYSGFGGDHHHHHHEPAHPEQQPYQASSGYPPAYQNYVPTPQSAGPYQAGPNYDAQSTPYVPPGAGGNRAYNYNV